MSQAAKTRTARLRGRPPRTATRWRTRAARLAVSRSLPASVQMTRSSGKSAYQGKPPIGSSET